MNFRRQTFEFYVRYFPVIFLSRFNLFFTHLLSDPLGAGPPSPYLPERLGPTAPIAPFREGLRALNADIRRTGGPPPSGRGGGGADGTPGACGGHS